MIPFLHIGLIAVPAFGLMVATALLVSAYVLQADFNRRRAQLERIPGYKGQRDEGFLIIGVAGIPGLIRGRLYHGLVNPTEFFAAPWNFAFSCFWFPWVGGIFGGVFGLVVLALRPEDPLLLFLGAC